MKIADISQNHFDDRATKEIDNIAEEIEKQDKNCLIDVDFAGDVLHLETEFGEYVINKHRVMKQIWLSSPISGPYHFDLHENGRWISAKNSDFRKILQNELSEKTGYEFKL